MHQTPCPRRPSGALTWLTMAGLMAACVALAACDSPPAPDASMAVSAERFSFTRTSGLEQIGADQFPHVKTFVTGSSSYIISKFRSK